MGVREEGWKAVVVCGAILLVGACIPPAQEGEGGGRVDPEEPMPQWRKQGRNMRPGPGYRFVEGLERPMAWGAKHPVTPTPIWRALEHVHFADVGRKWASAVPILTGPQAPPRVSPDEACVASFGARLDQKREKWMKVVSIERGNEIWAWKTDLEVKDIRWLTNETLLYSTDPNRWVIQQPSAWVIRKLNPFTKEESEVYKAPRGCVIWNFFPSPSGRLVAVQEEPRPQAPHSALFILNLVSGSKTRLEAQKSFISPFHVYWWPDEKHLYFEDTGDDGYGPVKASVEEPGRYEPLSRRFGQLGRRTKASLSPSGRKLLFGDPGRAGIFLLDLETGREEEIFRYVVTKGGCGLSDVAWSREEEVAAGRVYFAWAIPGTGGLFPTRGAGGVQYTVFLADFRRREVSFFRSDDGSGSPLFLIENPRVIEALKKRSVPWQ